MSLKKIFLKNKFTYKIYLYYNLYIRHKSFINRKQYSQWGEDLFIEDFFKNKNNGTYLDIGCFHPIRYNNTYSLYTLGWSGINIDLNPLSIDLFDIARPKDINICAAISNKTSYQELYFNHELSPLNTLEKNHTLFLSKHFGLKNLKKRTVKTKKINHILRKNKVKDIDFLNIDIEGHELKVLKSLDFNYFNVKVICVEIINYHNVSRKIKNNKREIINFLRKKKYILKFKSIVNYVFVKKD